MARSLLECRPALITCTCVASPQSNNSHSPSQTTATALTERFNVGFPEPVPSVITFGIHYDNTLSRTNGQTRPPGALERRKFSQSQKTEHNDRIRRIHCSRATSATEKCTLFPE